MNVPSLGRALALALLGLAIGCTDDSPPATPDAGAPGGDAAITEPDASATRAAHWEAIEPPGAGPINVWGFGVASLGDGRSVVFGGTNATLVAGTTLDGTWLFDVRGGAVTATEIAADGDAPAPRYCACAAWDPDRRRVVMTGGRDVTGPLALAPETWELDLDAGTWTRIAVPSSPDAIIGCMMAYARERHAMYLFGGAGAGGPSDKTYRYDPTMPAWVPLEARGPVPRYDGALEPLPDGRTLLLFAGSYGATGSAFYSDVWRFDSMAEAWSEVAIGGETPPGRRVPWVVLDPSGSGFFAAGGADGSTPMLAFDDLWWLDLEHRVWTRVATDAGPGPRGFSHALPDDPSAGPTGVMLSGWDGSGPVANLWRLMPD